MFKNHLKIAWRSILKDKLFTSIKIGGFAVGIAACLLIAFFIKDELSYDKHYEKKDRIYRVVLQGMFNGEVMKSVHFPLPFAGALQNDFPEIVKAGKVNASELFGAGKRSLKVSGESRNNLEDGFLLADQNALEVLEISLAEGDLKNAMTQPNSMVLSHEKAKIYFPNGNAVGKTVVLDEDTEKTYTVTGVMKPTLRKSHLNFDFLLRIEDQNMNWTHQNYFTYIEVDPNANVAALEKKMFAIMEDYIIPAQIERSRSADFIEVLKTIEYKLQPITDVHLKSDLKMNDGLQHGDIRFIWLFAAIAIFILLLACINFINLSTAKSANRAKEVGLRKTVGAFKRNLVTQFLTESVLFSIASFVLGVLLTWLLLPTFNNIAAKSINMPWAEGWFLTVIFISALVVGLIAGLYPAFYLSAFRPVNVLKGSLKVGAKSGRLRSGLVVFQFATSVILIISTLVIYKQMDFILQKELGYNKEQVLVINGAESLGNKAESFKNQLSELSFVNAISQSAYLPVDGYERNGNTFKKEGEGAEERGVPGQIWRVDYNYLNTLGIKVKQGRNFSKEYGSDVSESIIINEKMASQLGLKDPIGKIINNNYATWKIVGVIEDFHFKSLKEDIEPLSLVIGRNYGAIMAKLSGGDISESIASIAKVWSANMPNQDFNYTFLDQDFASMHQDVKRMGIIFNSFAFFAIFVACLGLFALSAFMVEQRKKEISIRMVLGAPFKSIYKLLTLSYMKLILISIAIAGPIGAYIMSKWLEDFAYKIEIGWQVFALSAIIAIGIALLTISYQSISAAFIKPLKSLRSE
ncbi:ABC transporter permease [Spongiivirga citrea]|uniref:FtsX-like permease family protein n=1 Tax=Spongiivirga citrea TaxID=1481457 RepID=A0A6M0CHK1_9FLAO|nr:ABC transporter permease [Spongiivirga citrea]NER17341.1 FtsX-like permease family protein [Spongiivirga citrea]